MRLAALLLAIGTAGCGSLVNLFEAPHVYGGVRSVGHYHGAEEDVASAFDAPFSFIMDTALLPLTLLFELSRAITEWPPPSDRIYPDPDRPTRKKAKEARRDLAILREAVDRFQARNGRVPTTVEGLDAAAEDRPRRDPWSHGYVYRSPGASKPYDLFSSGPDGMADTADDVYPEP